MHVVFRESHGLDEADTPRDLGQSPAPLIFGSFSDSDLSAFAGAWHRMRAGGDMADLRLVQLSDLRHPLSVDTWAEATAAQARAIVIRLIGGESYWPYGLATLSDLARRRGIALAILPADGRPDPRLDALSTVSADTAGRLKSLCDQGGVEAAMAALAEMARMADLPAPPPEAAPDWPPVGWYDRDEGADVIITFYRSYLVSGDMAAIDALLTECRQKGLRAAGVYVTSLKDPRAVKFLHDALTPAPRAIINATAFAARGALDGSAPVFQVALSTADRAAWAGSERGLSPADLAMHVVLPEVDGRIFLGVISHKNRAARDPDLQFSRAAHDPDPERIRAAVDRMCAWITPKRRRAVVLSTYPGKDWQAGHAVGLDVFGSLHALMDDPPGVHDLAEIHWPLSEYRAALARLPAPLRAALTDAWGPPEAEAPDGVLTFRGAWRGDTLVALQPERGQPATRADDYHDMTRVPCHAYVAFYLYLQSLDPHVIHMGAHGTLEWLPGKAVALGPDCWPEALIGAMPVTYPFIVNDPGEAAQARRRIGAVTLGHMPPPLVDSHLPPGLARLESLLDEYSNADGLDPSRRTRLIAAIRDEARALGVEDDLAIPPDAASAEAIPRIDRFVCDIKESQYGKGLHLFGTGDHGAEEKDGIARALSGRRVAAGPSGSPYRGRADVRPTGRNLYATDPRAVPSRTAYAQGIRMAEELIRRHLQDHGDWPRALIIDLWGSATMRTAGEEIGMAMQLAGLSPRWDEGSERVAGVDIIPLTELGRPRIEVTLRISGLFRDVFPNIATLFEQGVGALAARVAEGVEAPDMNPYRAHTPHVFGPRMGSYGLGMGNATEDYANGAARAGAAWLQSSGWAQGGGGTTPAHEALKEAVTRADGFVHVQDMAETDVLLAEDYAAHEAGFAAARASLGAGSVALYHLDTTRPDTPRARALTEEIARVVRARAANPGWADGMMAHGFRGAAEIAATLDHMAAFQNLAGLVPAHLFDAYFEATLGRDEVCAFMARDNPAALAAMRARFQALAKAGLWHSRRNSILAALIEGGDG